MRLLLIMLFAANLLRAADLEWQVDLSSALKKAAAEDKAVLLSFTGPDEQSQKLQTEVFEQPEFAAFTKANLIPVGIDVTPDPKHSEQHKKMVQKLVDDFDVESAPLVYILDKSGARLAKGGYVEGGAKNYISLIERVPGLHLRPYTLPRPSEAKGFTNLPEKAEAPFVILVPIVRYNDLFLKGLSFGRVKTALINNRTVAEGETATLRVANKPVKITLLQIREASAVIQVEDEANTRELFLRPKATPTPAKK